MLNISTIHISASSSGVTSDAHPLLSAQEYNENCVEVRDLEWLSPDTKVSWATTRRFGPLLARDFVTIVHYRTLADGTLIVVNRPAEHPDARCDSSRPFSRCGGATREDCLETSHWRGGF